jgi:phage terminase small subunit
MPKLRNPKWEAFAQAYVDGETAGNAARSYALVYGKPEVSRSVNASACQLIRLNALGRRIAELTARAELIELKATDRAIERLALVKQRVLSELMTIAFANLLDYATKDENGEPVIDLDALDREQGAAIQELTIDGVRSGAKSARKEAARKKPARTRVRIKLADKLDALAELGKHTGVVVERREITHRYQEMSNDELIARIAETDRRLAAIGYRVGSGDGPAGDG